MTYEPVIDPLIQAVFGKSSAVINAGRRVSYSIPGSPPIIHGSGGILVDHVTFKLKSEIVWSSSPECRIYLESHRPTEAELATRKHPERHRTIGELLGKSLDPLNLPANRHSLKFVD